MITKGQESLLKALVETLKVPTDGRWHIVSAYVRLSPGQTDVVSLIAAPIFSSRETRAIEEAHAKDEPVSPF